MIETKDLPDLISELRNVFSQIKGVKSLDEMFSLSYIVEVSSDQEKENVEKVAGTLSIQAKKYGFDLEVTPVTSQELEGVKKQYAEHISKQIKFKA